MLYKTVIAMAHLGSRVEEDTILDLTVEQAINYADAVMIHDEQPEAEPEVVPEVPLEEQTKEQLQATALELGLATTGSKADLLERISLHKGEEVIS